MLPLGAESVRPERDCVCGHSRDEHDEQGRCDECDCPGFVPEPTTGKTGGR